MDNWRERFSGESMIKIENLNQDRLSFQVKLLIIFNLLYRWLRKDGNAISI
jgi:hypothetical protein